MAAETGQLQLVTPTQGTLSGTWGDTVNNGITEYVNIAIAGTTTLNGDSPVTLVNTVGSASATNIVSTSAQYAIVRITGTTTVGKIITFGSAGSAPYSKTYLVDNAGSYAVTFKAYGQTGVSIEAGEKAYVYYNGTDIVKVASSTADGVTTFSAGTTGFTPSTATSGAVTLAGTLNVANGGTGLTSLTAGYIPFGAGTSAFGNSANLFWDSANTRLGIGTSSPNRLLSLYATQPVFQITNVASGNTQGTIQYQASGTTDFILDNQGSSTGGNIIFQQAGTARFQIGTAGQFGIGGATYGSSGQVLTSGGASAAPTWTTPLSLSANNTWTGTQSFIGTSSVLGAVLQDVAETATVSATAATGTIVYYPSTQSVLYYTSNASGNWTLNITFGSLTTMDTALSTGQSLTIAFLVTQGGTAYYNSSVQVDGTTSGVTTKWQGGTAPTAGNASSIDVYTYTIIKTASATFTVLASQTKFA